MSAQPHETENASRLAPELVPRRDFLGLAALWAAGVTAAFALIGLLRLPKAAVLPSPSKRFRVTLPESMAAGEPYVPAGRPVAMFRDKDGVYAVSIVCTHLGCVVKTDARGFHCPCHGSEFGTDGSVVRGPAPKALPWLAVKQTDKNVFVVDQGKTVPSGTKEMA